MTVAEGLAVAEESVERVEDLQRLVELLEDRGLSVEDVVVLVEEIEDLEPSEPF